MFSRGVMGVLYRSGFIKPARVPVTSSSSSVKAFSPCSLYTPDGCPLTLEERPSYAKTVKPTKVGGPCEQTMPHEEFREAWAKHFDVLAQLVKYFTNKDAIELFKEELILKDHTYESLKMLPFYYPQYALNMGPKLIRKKDGEQY